MADVQCGDCGETYEAGDRLAGETIRCTACGAELRIQRPAAGDFGSADEPRDPWDEPGAMAPAVMASAGLPSATSPARPAATGSKIPASRAVLWLWAVAGSVVVVLLMCGGIIVGIRGFVRKSAESVAGSAGVTISTAANLAEARRTHQTRLLPPGRFPQRFRTDDVPPDAERIAYRSGEYQLFGYFAKPEGGGPFPAVLHAHSSTVLSSADFDDARPLLEAGYAIFVPAWRGENGNPGTCETCYGEVDDAAAALDYLASRPDIDPNRLYATGHGTGGTIVMLLAEISPRLKAAMACNGCPDMQAWMGGSLGIGPAGFGERPRFEERFDRSNPLEGDLRSPTRHIKDLQCPLLLCYPTESIEHDVVLARAMTAKATELGKQVRLDMILGGYSDALKPAIERSITFFESLR